MPHSSSFSGIDFPNIPHHYRLLATPSLDLPRESWLVISEFEIRPGDPEWTMDIAVESRLLQGRGQLYFHAEVRLMD